MGWDGITVSWYLGRYLGTYFMYRSLPRLPTYWPAYLPISPGGAPCLSGLVPVIFPTSKSHLHCGSDLLEPASLVALFHGLGSMLTDICLLPFLAVTDMHYDTWCAGPGLLPACSSHKPSLIPCHPSSKKPTRALWSFIRLRHWMANQLDAQCSWFARPYVPFVFGSCIAGDVGCWRSGWIALTVRAASQDRPVLFPHSLHSLCLVPPGLMMDRAGRHLSYLRPFPSPRPRLC